LGFEFTGVVDDVRIYSRALTTDEIAAVMDGMTVEDVGQWPLSDAINRHESSRPMKK
jgi:hypothetical protein